MKFVYWTLAVLLALNAATSVLFFVLHLASGEVVPRLRAVRFYRYAVMVALLMFNIWIYRNVVLAIIEIFFRR